MSTRLLWPDGAPLAHGRTEEDMPALTPYLVESDAEVGAVIVCPGGGYHFRAPHEAEPIALWLNSFGISAFVLRYRVQPYRHPAPLLDVQRAVRHVRHHAAEYRVDPNHIGVLGFSAGGHLVATIATHFDAGREDAADPIDRASCRPDAAVLCYPVITFGPFMHSGSQTNLLGPDPDPKLAWSLSNETQVTPDTPPTFLWHTADDDAVPVENSLLFASALRRAGVPFELHVYESGRHGLGLATQEDPHVATWAQVCGQWLKGRGF